MASVSSPGQHGSYVLVTQATHDVDSDEAAHASTSSPPPPPRPRFFALLPLLALADLGTAIALTVFVLRRLDGISSGHADDEYDELTAAVLKTKRLVGMIMLGAVARTLCLSFIGCSKWIRQRVIAVAAICLMSILLLVSVANLFFLLPRMPSLVRIALPKLPTPTAALLVGHQLALTLLEWASYIAVVGVRVAPRRVGAANARRWQHGVYTEAQRWRGEDESLYDADEGEAYSDEAEEGQVVAREQLVQEEHRAPLPTDAAPASPLLRPTVPASDAKVAVAPLSPATPAGKGGSSRLRALSTHGATPGGPTSPSSRRSVHSPRTSLYGAVDIESQPFPVGDESDDDDLDPDDIVDIDPHNRRLARQESRRRLDAAKQRGDLERERRISTGVGLGMLGRSPTSISDFGSSSTSQTSFAPSRSLYDGNSFRPPAVPPPRKSSSRTPSLAGSGHAPTASLAGSSATDGTPTSRKATKLKRPSWLGGKKRRGRDSEGSHRDGSEA